MGRLAVILDPAGYSRVKEPGLSYEITGDELLRRWSAGEQLGGGAMIGELHLYNPPGSEWIMPRPRQFEADWTKNTLVLDDHVLTTSEWSFATGITPVQWDPSKKSGSAGNPDNKWQGPTPIRG